MRPPHSLRQMYWNDLASPSMGPRGGSVAGKETRRGMRRAEEWARRSAPAWEDFTQAYLDQPGSVLAWSDLHLAHDNIIGYTERPFGGARHMEGAMLDNALAAVSPEDWLLFVGDLAMWRDGADIAGWLARCPGRKALVLGNHDLRGRTCPGSFEEWEALGFDAVADCVELPAAHGLPMLWLTHYPLSRALVPPDACNVHGHTHRYLVEGPFVNMCVEHVDYRPVQLDARVRQVLG